MRLRVRTVRGVAGDRYFLADALGFVGISKVTTWQPDFDARDCLFVLSGFIGIRA
jgi:hypothetical protein